VDLKKRGEPVHGWVALDKPLGMTSTQAVAKVRRLFNAEKAGHGGTLDPLATGLLPIALGEATKTVQWAMDGRKIYRFTVKWGEERSTDDLEGQITASSAARPSQPGIEAILTQFQGDILQAPPAFSAIKVDGERAYELAGRGKRRFGAAAVHIEKLSLTACRTPIMGFSRPRAARAPISGRWPATWAAFWAVLAMSRRCGGSPSGRSARPI
jgi:tRNA pseudouridine55 synthase